MNLDSEDLRQCHKVLSSDIRECGIHIRTAGGFKGLLEKRIEDNKRVLARIETIIGKVEWDYGKDKVEWFE
jgi:hypothetical protein